MNNFAPMNAPKLSVIVPIYNEEENIPHMYRRLKAVAAKCVGDAHEFIFVSDGSRDNSEALLLELAAMDPHVKYLFFSRNFGHQPAISAGLDVALGEHIAIIDGDLQDPPELIEQMLAKASEGFEVVYARRKERKGDAPLKKVAANIFYRLLRSITQVEIPVDTGDFRLIHRKVAEVVCRMPEKNKFLRGQISWIGFRQTYVEFERDPRLHGTSGYSYLKLLKLAITGITSFSDLPLRLAFILGLGTTGVSTLAGLFMLYRHYVADSSVSGTAAVILSIAFFGGVQLIGIGILGEYLSRMYHDIRNRPLYIVRDNNVN